jgi:hypothetical protein
MSSQDLSVQKKTRGRPKGRTRPETVAVRLFAETIEAVDTWRDQQPDPKPTRPEAVRQLIKRGLGVGSKSAD